MITVLTCGTFDLFHIGHVRILKRAAALGQRLIVGVSSDELNISKKNKYPIYSLEQRMEILSSLKFVDEVFIEESLEKKEEYIKTYNADIFVIGDDWEGEFDYLSNCCQVHYLERTPSVSTTELIEIIRSVD